MLRSPSGDAGETVQQRCSTAVKQTVTTAKTLQRLLGSNNIARQCCREWPVDANQYELLEFAGKGAHAVVSSGQQQQQGGSCGAHVCW